MGLGRVDRGLAGRKSLGYVILVAAELDALAPGLQTAVAVLARLSASGADKKSDNKIVTDYGQNDVGGAKHKQDDAILHDCNLRGKEETKKPFSSQSGREPGQRKRPYIGLPKVKSAIGDKRGIDEGILCLAEGDSDKRRLGGAIEGRGPNIDLIVNIPHGSGRGLALVVTPGIST